MSAEPESTEKPTPWYLRIKNLVLAAGALAGAVVAMITLANLLRPPVDEEDIARIASVMYVRPSLLRDFATENLGGQMPMQPAPPAEGTGRTTNGSVASVRVEPAGAADAPIGEETPPPPEPDPAPDVSLPAENSEPPGGPEPPPESMRAATRDAMGLPEVEAYDLDENDLKALPHITADPTLSPSENPADVTPTVEEIATKLVEALVVVDGSGDPVPDPRGSVLVVSIELEGYKGEPMLLTWSLDSMGGDAGATIPASWSSESVAYRVVATTDHDTGAAEIWVPDLAVAGEYAVNVRLVHETKKALVAVGRSEPVPNP